MTGTETGLKEIVASLSEEHKIDPNPRNWSADEGKRIDGIITTFVRQMDPGDLTKLILEAEEETASVEEFIDTLCHKRSDFAGNEPDWLILLQAMAGFILTRTLESQESRTLAIAA